MDRQMRVELGGVDITEYVTEVTVDIAPPPGIGTTRKFKIEVTPEFAVAVQDAMRRAMPGTPYFWRSDPIPAPEPGVQRTADEFQRWGREFLQQHFRSVVPGTHAATGTSESLTAAERDFVERRLRMWGTTPSTEIRDEAPQPAPYTYIHGFEQDPDEQAALCRECGMWPDHHNHHCEAGLRCVCADCRPTAQDLESDQ